MSVQANQIAWLSNYQSVAYQGLSGDMDYVKLAEKKLPQLDVVLAFKPIMSRISNDAVLIGGKLSVFPVHGTMVAEPSSGGVVVQWLLSAYPALVCQKRGSERVGTEVASVYKGAPHEGAEFWKGIAEGNLMDSLLEYIEKQVGEPVENREVVRNAIRDRLAMRMPKCFEGYTVTGVNQPQNLTGEATVATVTSIFVNSKKNPSEAVE